MATKNVVPRADGEGNLGTSAKRWVSIRVSETAQVGDGFVRWDAEDGLQWSNDGDTWNTFEDSADGDVLGPASATDGALALFDGTSGKLLKETTVTISNGNISLASTKTVDGRDVSVDGAALDTLVNTTVPGKVTGPTSATDNAITRYDSTTGKLVQNSLATVDDSGNIAVPSLATVDGRDVSVDGIALDALVSTTVPSKVTGPSSATDEAIARFDGTTGKAVQNSAVSIDDSGNMKSAGTALFGSTGSIISGAQVQIDSTSKGFLPPRVTTVQKDAIGVTAADGLFVFDTDLNSHCGYNGSSWVTYGPTGTASTETMAKVFKVTSPIAIDADYVTAGVASTAANLFPGPYTDPDVPRALSVFFPSDWAGGNITIAGTDARGNSVNEVFAASVATTVSGTKAFATIASITKATVAGSGSSLATVGVINIYGVNADVVDSFGMGIAVATGADAFSPTIDVSNNTFSVSGTPADGVTSFIVTLNIAHTHTIA